MSRSFGALAAEGVFAWAARAGVGIRAVCGFDDELRKEAVGLSSDPQALALLAGETSPSPSAELRHAESKTRWTGGWERGVLTKLRLTRKGRHP